MQASISPARSAPWLLSLLLAVFAAGCKDQAATATPAGAAPPVEAAAPAPTPPPAPAAPKAPAPEDRPSAVDPAAAASEPAAAAPAAPPRRLPLSVQGVAPAGVTVRVKAVEIGGEATVLDVSISFANRITDSTMLALTDTFLEAEDGARLHIKRPQDNRDLMIREGQTLDGQLVFLGSVPTTARKLRLVFNEGNDGDNIVAPGLVVQLPLQEG